MMASRMERPPHRTRVSGRVAAFSIVELLIILAILGIIAGVIAINGRRVLAGQQERAALTSIRQSVWDGATAAAARGTTVELVRTSDALVVRDVGSSSPLRTFVIPSSVATNLPMGQVLEFTPPGRVDLATLQALPSPLTVTVNGHTFELHISIIGEVKATS
jgi:type II secretory pathway pseudopilin PulG